MRPRYEALAMRIAAYALTLFASAFLLFAVQPMAGKLLLPRLGGVPGAWTACLLFFQSALLLGYAYVWVGARVASLRARVAAHLVLAALALLALGPLPWPEGPAGLDPIHAPATWALVFLAANFGAPVLALGATGPLLQDWLAHTVARRPYFLYAASNAGSLVALVAYPLLIEPWLDLSEQIRALRVGLALVAAGVLAAGVLAWRVPTGSSRHRVSLPPDPTAPDTTAPVTAPLGAARRLRWIGLALVPSALLAGATSHLSLDLAPVPLLWVVPLGLYLLSFVLAFSERVPSPPAWLGRGACLVAVVLVFASTTHANEPVWLLAAMHLAFLAGASWLAHRRLADDAPDPAHLPEFYACLALGGVLGTLSSAVLAPALLPDLWEYPVAIALGCALRPLEGVVRPDRSLRSDLPHGIVVALLVLGGSLLAPRLGLEGPQLAALAGFGPAALYAYRWMPLRRRYTLCLLALVLAGALTQDRGERRLSARSFFGVLRVVDTADGERHLLHGTTLHGSQRLDQREACVPLAYYAREGPLGAALAAHRARGGRGRTLAIGLGTGSIACYAEPDEAWRFVEINPDVARLARDPRWFTYLARSPSSRLEVGLGDGRLALERERDASLSLLVVDAFNSDSVPAHLLTREALRLYLRKLEPGGWALLHLSNRVLDLEGVVADVVAAEGATARRSETEHATWAVVAREPRDLEALDASFTPLPAGEPARAWTDRASSLLRAIARARR